MAMYTGIVAYKKIKGVSEEAIVKTPFYSYLNGYVGVDERMGGYPTFDYLMDFLNIEEELEDTDEVYEGLHKKYKEEMDKIYYLKEQIDKNDLLDKVESKEVFFVSRQYSLAEKFGEFFGEKEFYFRRILTHEELLKLNEYCKEIYDMSWHIDKIKSEREEYIFEAHVS